MTTCNIYCKALMNGETCGFIAYDKLTIHTEAKPLFEGFAEQLEFCLAAFGVPEAFVSELDGNFYSTLVKVCDTNDNLIYETLY